MLIVIAKMLFKEWWTNYSMFVWCFLEIFSLEQMIATMI